MVDSHSLGEPCPPLPTPLAFPPCSTSVHTTFTYLAPCVHAKVSAECRAALPAASVPSTGDRVPHTRVSNVGHLPAGVSFVSAFISPSTHTHTHTHTPALDPEDPARTHLHPHTHRPTRASPSTPRRNIQARTRTHTQTTDPPLRHTPPPTPRSMGTRKISRKTRTVTRRTRQRPRAIRRPRGTTRPRSPSRTRPRSSRDCRGIRRKLDRPLRRARRGRQGREEGPCGRYSTRMVGWPEGVRRPGGWGARWVDKCLGRCRVLLLGGAARWGARSRQRPNWQWLGTTP